MAFAARPVAQTHLCVTARERPHGKLRRAPGLSAELAAACEPDVATLCALARTAPADQPLWLTGGEPCLRADLPRLIAALSEDGRQVGMISDGLALGRPGALEALREAGLAQLRLALHSARADAHDWLVGKPGACREVLRTARRALDAGMAVEVDATLTRPTAPHLAEWVQLVARLGARAAHLSRWIIPREQATDAITLSARFGLLEDTLEAAAAAAVAFKLPLTLWGVPHCTAPRLRTLHGTRELRMPADPTWLPFADPTRERDACGACAAFPECAGAPADYVARFGTGELESEQPPASAASAPVHVTAPEAAASAGPVPPPPPRALRPAATRVRFSREQVGAGPLHGDPIGGVPATNVPAVARTGWGWPSRVACPSCGDAGQPSRSARDNRKRLVLAAQQGSRTLRIASADAFTHPEARTLLADTVQLSFERVEVAGEAGPLAEWRDDELAKLKRFQRVRAALYGPEPGLHDRHMGCEGAFDAALLGLSRLSQKARLEVGCYGVLHDARHVAGYARAWEDGRLPGTPAFRLSPAGGSLNALAAAAAELPQGATRAALEALLPACLLSGPVTAAAVDAVGSPFAESAARTPTEAPSGSDPLGEHLPCRCGPELAARCPGRAVGWELDA